jgi:hypothetical protein
MNFEIGFCTNNTVYCNSRGARMHYDHSGTCLRDDVYSHLTKANSKRNRAALVKIGRKKMTVEKMAVKKMTVKKTLEFQIIRPLIVQCMMDAPMDVGRLGAMERI